MLQVLAFLSDVIDVDNFGHFRLSFFTGDVNYRYSVFFILNVMISLECVLGEIRISAFFS
jgi:hypothetical protein